MPTADPKQAARATESAAAAGSADVSAASAPARTGGLLARLGRWLDRDHLPDPEALRALYEASLTDGGANHLARQWAERYRAAHGLNSTSGNLLSDQQLSDLNKQLILAQADTANAKARYLQFKAIVESGPDNAVKNATVPSQKSVSNSNNSVINDLKVRYLDITKREREIASRFGESGALCSRQRRGVGVDQQQLAAHRRLAAGVGLDELTLTPEQLGDAVAARLDQALGGPADVLQRAVDRLLDTLHRRADHWHLRQRHARHQLRRGGPREHHGQQNNGGAHSRHS